MGERVSFKSNGCTASGCLARPRRPGPGIVGDPGKLGHAADPAFFNDTRSEVFAPEAAGDAWAKTLALPRRELGG